jgi:hypothetical protein
MTRFKKRADFDGEGLATAIALVGTETRAAARHFSGAGAPTLWANWTAGPNLLFHAPVSFCLIPKLQRLSSVHTSLHIELSGVNPPVIPIFEKPIRYREGLLFVLLGGAGGC